MCLYYTPPDGPPTIGKELSWKAGHNSGTAETARGNEVGQPQYADRVAGEVRADCYTVVPRGWFMLLSSSP